MPDQTIKCPHCKEPIPLTEALTSQLTEHIKADFAKQQAAEQKKLVAEREQIEKQKKSLEELEKKQTEELTKKIEAEKKKIWAIAQQKAKENQDKEYKDLQDQLKEKQKKLAEAEEQELSLRKKAREIEERERKLELEFTRKFDEEREKLVQQTKKQDAEEQQRKLAEKDKQMEILKKTIEDLKRQSEQGSMQIQGEVGEDSLKQALSDEFPLDKVTDVPTGITGADLVQKVNGQTGSTTAVLLWESKNTKAFSEQWLGKLKRDQEAIKADVAILVSRQLPATIETFGIVNGIWVTSPEYAVPLAKTLRMHLTEIAKIKRSLEGQDEKITVLYNYLTGAEFKNRVENIVLAFVEMQRDLESEKNSFRRVWSKRQKQLERLMVSTSGMYGDLQGIIGGALPVIQHLELDDPDVNGQAQLSEGGGSTLFD